MQPAPKRRSRFKRKRYIIPILIIVILIIFRIALPYMVKNYVNKVLSEIPGYYGHVEDIDIALVRGAYVIHGMYLNKMDAKTQVPFLNLKKSDISIEWKSLFKGKIVSEVILTEPVVIYVFEDQQKKEAAEPEFDDWSKALTNLVPIDINHLQIINGKAAFVQISANPNIDLDMNHIQLNATNLRNVVQPDVALPSNISATATSVGNGKIKLDGNMNLVKKIPDMDMAFSLENASITAFNDFTNHYAGIDFSEGNFNIFSEMAIADGFLTGYVKPLLKDSKLIGKEDGFFETLWEGFVGFFKFVLKNKKNNTLATKIEFKGDLNNVKSKLWPTIFNVVKNGWISAFKNTVDNDVDFEDAKNLAGKEEKKERVKAKKNK
ncbi:DUF748 domain-containing protein [Mariniflexile sp.]|uniref:DUF748 domain-containing protein n=1 Tax=Mariniflexile sp. TaxID=1979402 RepID=UPI004047BB59